MQRPAPQDLASILPQVSHVTLAEVGTRKIIYSARNQARARKMAKRIQQLNPTPPGKI